MAGGTLGGGAKRGAIVGINVTPMVDVMLVLLIIMMVSANYIVQQSIQVNLPKAANGDAAVSAMAVVTISKDGELHWNNEVVTEPTLVDRLKETVRNDPDVNLVVTADQGAQHGVVVHVLDLAKAEGITQFALGVERLD